MKNIEEATLSLLHLDLNDIKIADIAQKAAVSQVTIYNYYGSKEKLIETVILQLIERQLQRFEEIIETDLPFTEKLKLIISVKKLTARQSNIYKLAAQDERFREWLSIYFHRTIPLFMILIQQGRQSGHIRESVKDEALLFYLNLLERSVTRLDENFNIPGGFESISDGLTDLFLYGILKQN